MESGCNTQGIMIVPTYHHLVTSLLKKGEEVCFTVISGSMEPVLSAGDTIGIRGKKGPYHFGDIVLFRGREGFCTHRVISVKNGLILTKGDRRRVPDPYLTEDRILGHVVWARRKGRRHPLTGRTRNIMAKILGAFSLTECLVWRFCRGGSAGGWVRQ